MSAVESSIWDLIRAPWLKQGADLTRVEVTAGRGIPDVNGCFNGVDFWIELKATHHWSVDLRPEQIAWLTRRSRAGGNCWVLVRKSMKEGPDQLMLYHGSRARELKLLGCKAPPNFSCFVGMHSPGVSRYQELLDNVIGAVNEAIL